MAKNNGRKMTAAEAKAWRAKMERAKKAKASASQASAPKAKAKGKAKGGGVPPVIYQRLNKLEAFARNTGKSVGGIKSRMGKIEGALKAVAQEVEEQGNVLAGLVGRTLGSSGRQGDGTFKAYRPPASQEVWD